MDKTETILKYTITPIFYLMMGWVVILFFIGMVVFSWAFIQTLRINFGL